MVISAQSPKRSKGTSVAEVPVTLWVFFFLMMFPLMNLVTLGGRATLAYFGVRDATTKAALQTSFTSALSTAGSTLGKNAASWTGIGYSGTTLHVVEVTAAAVETEGAADAPWPRPIVAANVYLVRLRTSASVAPLWDMAATGILPSIPGISAPATLTFTYQVTAENPTGLTK